MIVRVLVPVSRNLCVVWVVLGLLGTVSKCRQVMLLVTTAVLLSVEVLLGVICCRVADRLRVSTMCMRWLVVIVRRLVAMWVVNVVGLATLLQLLVVVVVCRLVVHSVVTLGNMQPVLTVIVTCLIMVWCLVVLKEALVVAAGAVLVVGMVGVGVVAEFVVAMVGAVVIATLLVSAVSSTMSGRTVVGLGRGRCTEESWPGR